jgi:hypothetical protein
MAWLCENPEADPHRLSPREPFTFDLGGPAGARRHVIAAASRGRPRPGGRRTPENWLTPPPAAEETNFKRFGIK